MPVIRIENLSKSYRIRHGAARDKYRTLRESLTAAAAWPLRRLQGKAGGSVEEFWALKDVNLEVEQGEVVGIIGRNGAGKSTLLKILSRITAPTTGRVELRGRVGSLLEVGTGFHPELTGRENVYLNGSILGMSRREIQKKFDEIVEFSGVEKFLDTPVKRYSSGMYVRLAFAVAAHLDPEILIIDEVLAVGDAEFQKKCLGKMGEVAAGGRTVLFVSHNMAAVQAICARGMHLSQGAVIDSGPVSHVLGRYLKSLDRAAAHAFDNDAQRTGLGHLRLVNIELGTSDGSSNAVVACGDPVRIMFRLNSRANAARLVFALYDQFGAVVSDFDTRDRCELDATGGEDENCITCFIDELTLVPGRYRMNVLIETVEGVQDHVIGALSFDVQEGRLRGRPVPLGTRGTSCITHRWAFARPELSMH
ncbi:MAG: ABC transporter ATP-binding protein [Thermoguttaceae bacterium]|jgi:lipopolysaccharide transport system ATP-binding protein